MYICICYIYLYIYYSYIQLLTGFLAASGEERPEVKAAPAKTSRQADPTLGNVRTGWQYGP